MTRDKIQTAINEGIPFLIKMADGEKYEVTDRYRIALGRTTVIVVGKNDMPHAGQTHLNQYNPLKINVDILLLTGRDGPASASGASHSVLPPGRPRTPRRGVPTSKFRCVCPGHIVFRS